MAGSITESFAPLTNVNKLSFACVADATDGSFPRWTVQRKFTGRLVKLVTNPGATASVSPSASASGSGSASTSPSSSVSPSRSASSSLSPSAGLVSASASASSSLSPSSSRSPSVSASASASPSLSPSSSRSPSNSLSPSASASPTAGQPTDAYDIRLELAGQHVDLLEGVGLDRSSVTVQQVPIRYSGTSLHPVIHESDDLELFIDNQFAAGAVLNIDVYLALGY